MAKQTINPGTAPTGVGGDTFRSGSAKLQANDDEIYSQLGATAQGVLPAALPISKGGTGATTVTEARSNLGLGTAATASLTTSYTDATSGRVLKAGDFGLGARYLVDNSGDLSTLGNGLYSITTTSLTKDSNPAFGNSGAFINLKSHILTASAQIFMIANTLTSPKAWIQHINTSSNLVASAELLHTKNTTTDANGFIKATSPIVQLFADKIELNDEAEQQEITFEKLDIGDYLIKGSSGFALEGWYVETPKDANGNVLFSVIYTTLENGDISVKTYKKKFDFETVSIVADLDNPVDITENRWIDLRLQELPQPEIEELESIAPPEFQPTGLAQAVATVMESYHDPEQ